MSPCYPTGWCHSGPKRPRIPSRWGFRCELAVVDHQKCGRTAIRHGFFDEKWHGTTERSDRLGIFLWFCFGTSAEPETRTERGADTSTQVQADTGPRLR